MCSSISVLIIFRGEIQGKSCEPDTTELPTNSSTSASVVGTQEDGWILDENLEYEEETNGFDLNAALNQESIELALNATRQQLKDCQDLLHSGGDESGDGYPSGIFERVSESLEVFPDHLNLASNCQGKSFQGEKAKFNKMCVAL